MKWVDQSPPPDWPVWPAERPLPALGARPRVLLSRAVHLDVLAQLRASPVEDGGLLLGVPWRSSEGEGALAFVELLQAVAAPSGTGTMVSLRMDRQVWSAANDALTLLQARVKPARVVGWYHSHPGFGAFFSDTDRSTQAAFFRQAYGVGWCIDPSDDSHAFFLGSDSVPTAAEVIAG